MTYAVDTAVDLSKLTVDKLIGLPWQIPYYDGRLDSLDEINVDTDQVSLIQSATKATKKVAELLLHSLKSAHYVSLTVVASGMTFIGLQSVLFTYNQYVLRRKFLAIAIEKGINV